MAAKRFTEWFKSLDMFGEQISLNYKGKSSYNTKLGAVVSLVSYLMLLTYAINMLLVVINRRNPSITNYSMTYDGATFPMTYLN